MYDIDIHNIFVCCSDALHVTSYLFQSPPPYLPYLGGDLPKCNLHFVGGGGWGEKCKFDMRQVFNIRGNLLKLGGGGCKINEI